MLQNGSSHAQKAVTALGPKLYVSQLDSGAANRGEPNRARPMPTNDKETSVFYLKLQWVSTKDEAERKRLGEKIQQLLNQPTSKQD
jgi:hypothetical protein